MWRMAKEKARERLDLERKTRSVSVSCSRSSPVLGALEAALLDTSGVVGADAVEKATAEPPGRQRPSRWGATAAIAAEGEDELKVRGTPPRIPRRRTDFIIYESFRSFRPTSQRAAFTSPSPSRDRERKKATKLRKSSPIPVHRSITKKGTTNTFSGMRVNDAGMCQLYVHKSCGLAWQALRVFGEGGHGAPRASSHGAGGRRGGVEGEQVDDLGGASPALGHATTRGEAVVVLPLRGRGLRLALALVHLALTLAPLLAVLSGTLAGRRVALCVSRTLARQHTRHTREQRMGGAYQQGWQTRARPNGRGWRQCSPSLSCRAQARGPCNILNATEREGGMCESDDSMCRQRVGSSVRRSTVLLKPSRSSWVRPGLSSPMLERRREAGTGNETKRHNTHTKVSFTSSSPLSAGRRVYLGERE